MEWNKCRVSGQLTAVGKSAQYFIYEGAWFYLKWVEVDVHGPQISEEFTFNSLEEAKQYALEYDNNIATSRPPMIR